MNFPRTQVDKISQKRPVQAKHNLEWYILDNLTNSSLLNIIT